VVLDLEASLEELLLDKHIIPLEVTNLSQEEVGHNHRVVGNNIHMVEVVGIMDQN
jgi:hypothetical protein